MPNQHSMDRDHVVLLEKLDRMIIVAEGSGVDEGLIKRMFAIRALLVVHANKAQDLKEEVVEIVATNKIKILIIGAIVSSAIGLPYLLVTRTTVGIPSPIMCKEFKTTSFMYPGKIEVCMNGITKAYSALNGDAEIDLTFMQSPTERIQADVVFWLADEIAGRKVDYRDEYNIERIRIYDRGWLVSDSTDKLSGWSKPLVPIDVRSQLWHWVHHCRNRLIRDRPPFEEVFQTTVNKSGGVIATIGSILVTAYRFFRAQ